MSARWLLLNLLSVKSGLTQNELTSPPSEVRKTSMKNGFKALDSDMHVYDPPDLYLNYMDRKWGDRIPRGEWPKGNGRV